MDSQYHYYAFISYKREDEKWAKWLQYKLEHYKLPSIIRKQYPSLPDRVRPVFKDTTDLSGGILETVIKEALESSKYLIVICSPRAAQSPWVCKEVQEFIDSSREEYIIPFIVDGEPNSVNIATECFPKNLRELTGNRELLGININENGRDAASIKVIARMFNLQFDTLWQRFEREQKKKRLVTIIILLLLTIISVCVGGFIVKKNTELEQANYKILLEQDRANTERNRAEYTADSLEIANKNIEQQKKIIQQQYAELKREKENLLNANWNMMESRAISVSKYGRLLIDNHDTYTARLLALSILPHSLGNPNKPYTYDAEALLRDATLCDNGILRGHRDAVKYATFNSDGKKILSASWDSTICVWDSETGQLLNRLNMDKKVKSVLLHPNGVYLLSVFENDSNIYIYNIETELCTRVLSGHSEDIMMARYSKDGSLIVSISEDNTIRVWNTEGGCIQIFDHWNFRPSTFPYKDAFISHDNKFVSALYDYSIDIGDVASGATILSFDPIFHDEDVSEWCYYSAVDISPNANAIALIVNSNVDNKWIGSVYYMTDDTTKNIQLIGEHSASIRSVRFSPSGQYLVTTSTDCIVKVWDINKPSCLHTFDGHKQTVNYAEFNPTETMIVSVSDDNTIRLWDLQDNSYQYHGIDEFFTPTISFDSKYYATISYKDYQTDAKILKIWDIISNKLINIIDINDSTYSFIYGCQFRPQYNDEIATYCSDNSIRIWDCRKGSLIKIIPLGKNWIFEDFRFSFNGQKIIFSQYDRIGIIDLKNQTIRELDSCAYINGEYVTKLAVSPNEETIIFLVTDSIRVWDVKTGHCIKTFPNNGIELLEYSRDGKYVITITHGGVFKVWNHFGECIHVINEGYYKSVKSASFSYSGKYILISYNKVVRVYDFASGNCIQTLNIPENQGVGNYAIFSPNEKHIIAVSGCGTLYSWEFPTLQELIVKTQEKMKRRKLTQEECQKYYLDYIE